VARTVALALARRASRRWRRQDPLEFEQAALIGLWRAGLDFDPNGGASWRTYATRRIWWSIVDSIRWLLGQGQTKPVALEEDPPDPREPLFDALDREEQAERVRRAVVELDSPDPRHREILQRNLEGLADRAIAERYGLSSVRVWQLRAEATRHLAAAMTKARPEPDPSADVAGLQCNACNTAPLPKPAVRTLAEVEREAIEIALDHTGGHVRRAALLLGIGHATLYRKIRNGQRFTSEPAIG